MIGIVKEGLRPGGHKGGRAQVFLNPYAPWDERYENILGGALTHLGQARIALAFSVHRLMGLGVMINASCQLVISGNIPFSEVIGAWYQANNYNWERLLVDSGRFQLVRSCKEPREIATASTVMRIAKALLSEINAEDNIPYYDEFVKDVEELEKANGVLTYQDDLRNRLVTFIAENYVPREAGRTICPACLTETPNNLSICIRCHGSLISWGEKCATQDESAAPGEPERERRQSGDGTEDAGGDVEMDKDEIDRLVKESKKKAEEKTDDDVDMSAPKSSQPSPGTGSRRTRTTHQPQAAFGGRTKEQQEAQKELPAWTARLVPGSISIDIAENEDAIDSTARTVDTMILSYLKDRFRLFHAWTALASAPTYYNHIQNVGLLPGYDGYIPYVGEDDGGELKEPAEVEYEEAFKKYSKNGKFGGRELESKSISKG